ncbi:hypothetical protein ACGVWS_00045 [Enterobacteriaceae bacterium LUAb1]
MINFFNTSLATLADLIFETPHKARRRNKVHGGDPLEALRYVIAVKGDNPSDPG